jgi:PPOX class probable F420-dependent enzyme
MSLAMNRAERESFLAATRVAVLSVTAPGRGPLSVPVWYDYEPGGVVRVVTMGTSRKAKLMREAGRATLCVQSDALPYKYVSVEGPVTFGQPDPVRDVQNVTYRYLGEQMGATYLQMTAAARPQMVLVELHPVRWTSEDYSKMG